MLLDFLAGNSGVMNVWMCFVLNKVIQNNQILSEGSYTLPFFAFVEISIQGVNDNMILIQISWIDNPIRLQEGKAADLHPSSQPSYFHLRRRIALYSSYWPLKWILSTTLFPPHSRLLHHHRKYLYEFYRASRPPLEWWYLSVQRDFDPWHDFENFPCLYLHQSPLLQFRWNTEYQVFLINVKVGSHRRYVESMMPALLICCGNIASHLFSYIEFAF